jgi:hypothetical protein
MPMIDVHAPGDLFSDGVDGEITQGLTLAARRGRAAPGPGSAQQHGRLHPSREPEGGPHSWNGLWRGRFGFRC